MKAALRVLATVCATALLVLITTACQTPAAAPPAADATAIPDSAKAPDIWTRSRQCADDSDRLATRLQRQQAASSGAKVIGWSNHYNRKDSRCYVEINYVGPKGTVPRYSRELYDAVEVLQVASFAQGRMDAIDAGIWCFVPSPSPDDRRATAGGDCKAAEKFIAERMTN
jgi:hypothetical protein